MGEYIFEVHTTTSLYIIKLEKFYKVNLQKKKKKKMRFNDDGESQRAAYLRQNIRESIYC